MGKNGLETQIVASQFTISEKYMHQNHITSVSYFTEILLHNFQIISVAVLLGKGVNRDFKKPLRVYVKTKMTTASI